MIKQRPAVRLMTIVGLLLIPIAILGYLFFQTTTQDIAFASKERDGVALLRRVVPVVAKLSVEESSATTAELKALQQAGNELGQSLRATNRIDKLVAELNRGDKGREAALRIGRELIVHIGDTSNLILDPDLDSYYLMDSVVIRLPDLLSLSADLVGHAETHGSEVTALDSNLHRQLTLGEFKSTLSLFRKAMGKVSDQNNRVLDVHLFEAALVYAETAGNHSAGFLKMDQTILDDLRKTGQLETLQKNYAETTLRFWSMAATNLDALLQSRINTLLRQQLIAGGITALVTIFAIGLAITLLSRIVNKLDERIVYLAHHDAMTTLKNRTAFSAELASNIVTAKHTNTWSALHLVDVDHFKSINDKLGHQLGDEVLIGIARRLTAICGPDDMIGRLGGDEFVVLQRNITDQWQAISFAERLVSSLRDPLEILNKPFKASASIGTALLPLHGDTTEKVMHSADLALYAAKAAGRDRACFYSETLNAEMVERQRIENEVRSALAEDRFFLNFQAQFTATGKTLRGFEALLRLRTTNGETIAPLQFIPLVEQMGLIDDVGAWVLEKAAMTAANWPDQVSLAVNISPLQLRSGKLCDAIRNALRLSGIRPARLEIEVTENILMDDTKSVLLQLQDIKAMGVSIALDDFGSGYSSLSYLWRFPFSKLKIDRSFMRAYEADRQQAENILRTIVMLGHSLKMTVTAEGVETNAQANFLNGVKCDEIQGFLYAKPVPEQDLAALMMKAFEDEIEDRKLISILAPDSPKAINSLFKPSRTAS